MDNETREIRRKLRVLQHAERIGNINKACRYFGVSRSNFYIWRARYRAEGEEGLRRRKATHRRYNQTPDHIAEKILHLRRTYHMGSKRISWYLKRYHDISVSPSTAYRICRRNGMRRLPSRVGRRAVHTHRYEKRVPGHHVQVDVKFLNLRRRNGQVVRRYQFTAIDDATRVRALKVYKRHTQANAIKFIDYVVDKFPFRINTIRTDRGHEFQALFHWHCADKGLRHDYIKPRTPQHNGKVERSHRTDKEEFYQLLSYRGDVDLEKKLAEWEKFYNFARPHGAHNGKTPYEALVEKIR